MKVGYARVSTTDQSLENQISRLAEIGCELFFEEKTSGAAKKRPQLEKLLGQLRKDDVVVITRLDRLARSTAELLRIAEVLKKNAGIQPLDEPSANTTTPAGKMIMTVFGGIAEFERSLILSRTQEGREVAMARGVAFGRPSKPREDQKDAVRDLVKDGRSISIVARTFNVHPATIYRCLDEK